MNIIAVVYQIAALLLIAGCGIVLRKRQTLTDPVIEGINTVVLNLVWPAMILTTTQKNLSSEWIPGFLRVLLLSTLLLSAFSIILYLCARKRLPQNQQAIFSALCVLPNAAFIGLPVVQAFYGEVGITYLAAYIVGFNFVMWTVFPILMQGKFINPIKSLINFNMLSCIAATLLFVFQIRIPEPFITFLQQLANLITPMSMLLLGARLPESFRIDQLKSLTLWISVFIRLFLFPLVIFGVLRLIGISGLELGILVLVSAMPCASSVELLAENYRRDYRLATQGISISILLCLASIPLILWITRI